MKTRTIIRSFRKKNLWPMSLGVAGVSLVSWLIQPIWSPVGVLRSIGFGLVVGIGLLLVGLLFDWSVTLGRSCDAWSHEELEETQGELYAKWYLFRSGAFFVCVPIAGIAVYAFLVLFSRSMQGLLTGEPVIAVVDLYWSIPAIFLGIVFGSMIVPLLTRGVFRKDHARLTVEYNIRVGLDARKSEAALLKFAMALSFFLVFGGLNDHVRFDDSGIGIQRFYRLGEDYHPYGDVASITEITKQIEKKEGFDYTVVYEIAFSDGTLWQSENIDLVGERAELYGVAITHVAKVSQVKMVQETIVISR